MRMHERPSCKDSSRTDQAMLPEELFRPSDLLEFQNVADWREANWLTMRKGGIRDSVTFRVSISVILISVGSGKGQVRPAVKINPLLGSLGV